MSAEVRVAVIGGGAWGSYHLLAALSLERQGKAKLVGVATRTEASARALFEKYSIPTYTDYRELIATEAPDAVTIATPDHLHREIALHALAQGMHVLVEKPMDVSAAGCREILALADANDLLLQVDHHKRYDPCSVDVKHQVEAGHLGTPYYGYAYMEDNIVVPTERLATWANESSPFWFLGVHQFDLMRWVTGLEAVAVLATGQRGKLSSQGVDTMDAVSATIQWTGGFTCGIDVNWILPRNFEALVNQGFRLVGSEGIVELDLQDRGSRYSFASTGTLTPNVYAFYPSIVGNEEYAGYFVEPIKHFLMNVAYLKSGGDLTRLAGTYPSGLDGLRAVEAAEAVDRSLREKRIVTIDEIRHT